MNLVLQRDVLVTTYTLGQLSVDGRHIGFTLEDPMREIVTEKGYKWLRRCKLAGKTAIPAGRYEVIVSFSQRFRRPLPLLLRVPDFEGIRVHGGNDVDDTEGCPLLGLERDINRGRVWNCPPAVDALTSMIREASAAGKVWFSVVNP